MLIREENYAHVALEQQVIPVELEGVRVVKRRFVIA